MEVKKILSVLCLCVLFSSTVSNKAKSKIDNEEDTYGELDDENVQKDDNNYEDNIEDENNIVEEENEPRVQEGVVEFKTQPQIFIGNIGDTIRMPCAVSNPDIVNIWQKDETILYQDHSPLAKHPNIQELNYDHTLEVNITSDADYGSYTCELIIKNNNNPKIVHRLMRPTPPVITGILTENNKTEYAAGETLRLTCVASGLPKPIISWHKGSERLELTGETITIPNLSESDGGIYRCLADNHVQKPSHHHIVIYINHAPKITIGQYVVTSNKEKDTELICTVDAYPSAHPIWRRGSQQIQNDGNKKISIKRREHTIESVLVISSLSDEDFTNYTCFAKNELGRSEKVVSLVKIPAVREFVKPEKNLRDVVLSWKVESKSPIEAHEIQYRKKGDQSWRTAVPEVTNADNDIYTVKYTLKDLDVGSYETRLRSKNEHGWSEFSEIMPFEGVLAKHGSSAHKNQHKKHHKEKELKEKHIVQDSTSAPQQQEISQKEAPVGESKPPGGSSGKVSASVTILSIASIFLFYIRQ